MKTMIVKNPRLLTKLEIWAPRYHDKYTDTGEMVVTLAKYKVDAGTGVLLIEFTKAKHLMGQKYCIPKTEVQKCSVDSNGKIPVYVVKLSDLYTYDTVAEVKEIVSNLWPAHNAKSLGTVEEIGYE